MIMKKEKIVNVGSGIKTPIRFCRTCKHFGCPGHEGYGKCNKLVRVKNDNNVLFEFAWQKQNNIACESYWDDQDSNIFQDSFGFEYEYIWLRNRFECRQTGQSLSIEYRERLREHRGDLNQKQVK